MEEVSLSVRMCQSFCSASAIGCGATRNNGIDDRMTRGRLRRRIEDLGSVVAGAVLTALLACSSVPAGPRIDAERADFSAARTAIHLARLAEIGVGPRGSAADRRARRYVQRELKRGMDGGRDVRWTRSWDPDGESLDPLVVTVEGTGEAAGAMWVVAPYETGREGRDDQDVGLAIALELARALVWAALPYSLSVAIVPVDGHDPHVGISGADPGDAPTAPRGRPALREAAGRRALAALVESVPTPPRAVLVIDPAPGAPIARSLRGHPIFRSIVWSHAAARGHERVFPASGDWSDPAGLHTALLDAGMSQVVPLGPPPSAAWQSSGSQAFLAPQLARAVGESAFGGLLEVADRLRRIDEFAP